MLRNAQYLEVGKRSLAPNPSRPHPQPLSKGRGEWYALYIARLLLVNLLSTSFTPCPSRPHPQPFSKERGEWYALYIARLLLVNWLTRQLLCFSLDYFFVHFSVRVLTQILPFLSTNRLLGRKNSILARVCFDATKGQPVDVAR